MDLQSKLNILSDAAKYDVSCSSSGSSRKSKSGFLGDTNKSGICHSFTQDGRCISLLKILFTNFCIYDCSYCINRISNDVKRASFTPEEVAELTMNFYRRNYIEGLFLSSSIVKNPDYTMELLYKTLKLLREGYRFNGYIHVKAIPGASMDIIRETGYLADRISLNIELPSSSSLKLLAPEKKPELILNPMKNIAYLGIKSRDEGKKFKNSKIFVPAGQSTQLIVGATPESDSDIINLSEKLYEKFDLKRVYYSAYMPINTTPNLPALKEPPLLREHRLYQADWLLRFYGFKAQELLNKGENIDPLIDPKTQWALNNINFFPLEINKASFKNLIRTPGIGIKSAERIVQNRIFRSLSFNDLKAMGVVLKRAKYFILISGKYFGETELDKLKIYEKLTRMPMKSKMLQANNKQNNYKQVSFFDDNL